MISLFGKFMRTNFNDSIKEMALKLNISVCELSKMEVGRMNISSNIRDRIVATYCLNEEKIMELDECILKTNDRVNIELELMNQAMKNDYSLAREIKTMDEELLMSLKEALLNEKN